MTHLVAYRLRSPNDPTEVYGDDIADEQEAFARARQLADFYQQPVEVCHVTVGRIARSAGCVDPGPLAPTPPFALESPPS